MEAEAILDYFVSFIQKDKDIIAKMDRGEKTSLYIVSPFRTQAHLIRNLLQDKVYLNQILQNKKKNKEKFQSIDGVGCLEDLVSN